MPSLHDSLSRLDGAERLLLLQWACSFAWVDGEVQPEERGVVQRLSELLELAPEERALVRRWLSEPPGGVDVTAVTLENREAFVNAVSEVIAADGEIHPEERRLFDKLLAPDPDSPANAG